MKRSTLIPRVRSIDFGLLFLPVTALAVLLSRFFAGLIARAPSNYSEVLASFQGELWPKPEEQIAYVLLLLLWASGLLGGLFFLSRLRAKGWKSRKGSSARFLLRMTPPLVLAFFLLNVYFQEFYVHHYFGGKSPTLLYGIASFLAALWAVLDRRSFRFIRGLPALGCSIAAVVASVFNLLPGILTESNFSSAPPGVATHLPYTFGEFAAVAAGRTLSVDLFSQYQQLLPYLVAPIFRVFGLGISVYTGTLAVFSAWVLFFVYRILRRLCDSPGLASLFFFAWIGMSFFPIDTRGPARYSSFTYFPIGPLRLFGFFAVAALSLFLVRKPLSFGRQTLGLFVAWLVLLNNFDFGVPALIGCLAVFLVFGRNPLRTVQAFFVGAAGGFAFALGIPLLRTGRLPDLGEALEYISAVGRVGYTALPTPPLGYHWIFLFSFFACIGFGISGKSKSPARNAALLFFGVAGCGIFAYYMNRSHWHVLAMMAPVGYFAILLLIRSVFENDRRGFMRALAVICLASGLALFLKNFPNPVSQWKRMIYRDPTFMNRHRAIVEWIRSHLSRGEKVAVAYPFGDWIAFDAGVLNVFPYPHNGSLVLVRQLERSIREIETNRVHYLMGDLPIELSDWARSHGFRRTDSLDGFEVWSRSD